MYRWLIAIAISAIVVAAGIAIMISLHKKDITPKEPPKIIKTEKPVSAPKKEKDKEKDKDKKGALIVLVLDDFGYTKKNLKTLEKINAPITLAILPNAPYSETVSLFAKDNGFEVILHIPMEPENMKEYVERDTITTDMDNNGIERIMARAFQSVPGAKGASNHMGSKATKDDRIMETVFNDLKKRKMFFLDSATTAESVCERTAKKIGLEYARRNVFLDNVLQADNIKRQLEETEKLAFKKGSAIAIGHDRKVTVEVLSEMVPRMQRRGIRFVTLSEIIYNKR